MNLMPEKQRLTLQRKHNARVAAVQAIFSHRVLGNPMNGDAAAARIAQQWQTEKEKDQPEWDAETAPQKALLESILIGVAEQIELLEEDINSVLRDDWKLSRINPILLSILLAAAYELKQDTSRKTAIIISQYVDITDSFIDGAVVDFVNGALNNLAAHYRAEHPPEADTKAE